MRHDPAIQFNLAPPVPRSRPPSWLEALLRIIGKVLEPIGRLIAWIASFLPSAGYARVIVGIVIAAGVAALIWALVNRWRRRRAEVAELPREEEDWMPEEDGARSWLEEADLLAQEGRYSEAIHHLLYRSIEDISKRRPKLVRPALTSRELAGSQVLPAGARELFTKIASVVEESLFGGRRVNESEWIAARKSYSQFVLPAAWRP